MRAARAPGLDAALRDAAPDALARLARGAHKAVAAILSSDAPLLYPPGALALAGLRSGARGAGLACGAFIEHAAARGGAAAAAARAAPAPPIPGGANPPPAHLAPAPGGGGALQQLLGWLGEVDALVVAAMAEDEAGLEARATDIDRRIKLWRKAASGGGGSVAAAAGGGGEAAAAPGGGGGEAAAATGSDTAEAAAATGGGGTEAAAAAAAMGGGGTKAAVADGA